MEKLENELKKALQNMNNLKEDYTAKNNDVAAEACENCILHLKRAIVYGLYTDDIKEIEKFIYPIASSIVNGNEESRKTNVAELVYNLKNK